MVDSAVKRNADKMKSKGFTKVTSSKWIFIPLADEARGMMKEAARGLEQFTPPMFSTFEEATIAMEHEELKYFRIYEDDVTYKLVDGYAVPLE